MSAGGDEDDRLDVEVEDLDSEELELFNEPEPEPEGHGEGTVEPAPAEPPAADLGARDIRGVSAVDGEGTDDDDGRASQPPPPVPRGGPLPDAEREVESDAPARPLRLIAVGGARGGVGKSILAANLGLYLATIGRKVVLVDADPAGANLHTCLGTQPATPLNKLRKGAAPSEGLCETPFRGLSLLHLGLDEPGAGSARGDRLTRLIARLRELDAEYVVVDQGVGLAKDLLDNYLSADLACFVTVPEPSAIENTYRFLRGAFMRFLLRDLGEDDRTELERRMRALGGAPPPLDLLRELEQEQHPLAVDVRAAIERFRPRLLINQTRLRADLQLGYSMQSAIRRRLGLTVDYLGHIDHDDTVWTCVRNRRPLLLEVPGAKSSRKIEKLARRLLMIEAGKAPEPSPAGVPQESHHDLLEVERGATDEEVRRAYKRCREVYAHDALCCYGLLEPHEVEKLRARVDEAFDVLLDPARRRPYELSVFPDQPEPSPQEPVELNDEPPRPAPDVTPDTQFTGALLRQVRESRRVALRDISHRTKISVPYLTAIEEDDFGKLPAVVYTTGFLTEYARFLRLDSKQVSRTYVTRFKRYLEDKERAFARKA